MARRGTDYTGLNRQLAWADDGRPVRSVGGWTRDKLALLAYYLPAFAKLCTDKVGGWYYLDGFAANGVNRTQEFPLAKGTALIGLSQSPPPTKALLIERNHDDVETLRARSIPFLTETLVLEGDANELIPKQLAFFDLPHLPGFCVLDPEGLELDWTTIQACAEHRRGRTPYELLIYFSTPGAARTGAVQAAGYVEKTEARLQRLFGNESWREVAQQQGRRVLAPGEASNLYLSMYESQLRNLGYTTVLSRPSLRQDGVLVYHMVFASANEAGASIMASAFKRAYGSQVPLQF